MKAFMNALQAGNRSGTGAYTQALARALCERLGADALRVAWPRDLAHPGIPDSSVVRGPGGGLLQRLAADQLRLPREARRWGADVLHYPANIGALRSRVPVVLTVHDLSFLREPEWFGAERAAYYRHGAHMTIPRAARLIAVSHATADDLVALMHIPQDRIDVIHNGVDDRFRTVTDEEAEACRERHGLPDRFFLYFGTLEPRKNLVRLVEAFSLVADSDASQHLVLAGRVGWKCEALLRAVEASPARDRIHLPGFIDDADAPALLHAARVFVYPSLYEGFGLPVAEAMAAGVPVVTSNVSSLPEISGDAALLVDPQSVDAIAAAMRRLWTDEELRAERIQRGLTRSRQFTWRRAAEHTIESYRKALRG